MTVIISSLNGDDEDKDRNKADSIPRSSSFNLMRSPEGINFQLRSSGKQGIFRFWIIFGLSLIIYFAIGSFLF